DLDKDGYDEIILGGVNNAYGNLPGFDHPLTLVVLDSRNVAGQGLAPVADNRHFQGLSSGRERAALFLRNFGRMPADGPDAFCAFQSIVPRGDHFEAVAMKRYSIGLEVTYQFDAHLNLEFAQPKSPLVQLI